MNKFDFVAGAPGTGKSHVCGMALAYAVCNGLVCFITSLAARRSAQLGGEHLHRLFAIPLKKIPACDLAKEALGRLENDIKRRYFLEQLQVLIVEEISLIQAELWATIDLVLQMLKQNELPFGGILIIANGDCCQLPNVEGTDIFLSSNLIFNFNFHFLEHLVRMVDVKGQEVLRLLEQRPVPMDSIDRICELLSENCNFHSSWQTVEEENIMKVFGKKSAEQQALDEHRKRIEQSGNPFFVSKSVDEMCVTKSHVWRAADVTATKYLKKNCREPEMLIVYPKAVLRLTRNLETSSQGDLCVVDFQRSNDTSIHLFKAPNPQAITKDVLNNNNFQLWQQITVHKTSGYVFVTNDASFRRKQFPLCNYIALTIHKLMGDTFHSLVTSISSFETMYSLWLTSQIYVIISRVRTLSSLHFVGSIERTLTAVRKVLSTTHLHEESVYQFMSKLRSKASRRKLTNVPCTMYLRNHFEVPITENGFIYLLVSMADNNYSTYYIDETDTSLSDALRLCNSTHNTALLEKQPWAMGFFIWHFPSRTVRAQCLSDIRGIVNKNCNDFETLCTEVELLMTLNYDNLFICITGKVVRDETVITTEI